MLLKVFSIGYNIQCIEKLLYLLSFAHVVFLYGFLSIIKLCFPWFKFICVAFHFSGIKNAKYYLDRMIYCSSTAYVYLLIKFFERFLMKKNKRALKTFNAGKKLFYNNYIRNNIERNINNAAYVTRNNAYSYNGIHFLITYLIRLILMQLFYHKLLGSSLAASVQQV